MLPVFADAIAEPIWQTPPFYYVVLAAAAAVLIVFAVVRLWKRRKK